MDIFRNGFLVTWFALLLGSVTPCYADNLEPPCQGDCDNAALIEDCWQPGTSYPTKLVPRQPDTANTLVESQSPPTVLEWQPPDNHWFAKLRGMRELRLLTLWKSEGAQVFLGVSERGVPGLALSSRRSPRTRSGRRNDETQDWRRRQESLIYF